MAVDANPVMCNGIRQRFAAEIEEERLIVECCVVTAGESTIEVDFYLHNLHSTRGQFPKPSDDVLDLYTKVRLPSRSFLSIIKAHGDPHYVKLDIEHYDAQLLGAMFDGGMRPPFVSAEAHSVEVFAMLTGQGGYGAFKLVDGASVENTYADRSVMCHATRKPVRYSFPNHSAGPFGEDIDGPWMKSESFLQLLAFEGFGWKDIHASMTEVADPSFVPRVCGHLDRLINGRELLAYVVHRAKNSIASRVGRLFGGTRG